LSICDTQGQQFIMTKKRKKSKKRLKLSPSLEAAYRKKRIAKRAERLGISKEQAHKEQQEADAALKNQKSLKRKKTKKSRTKKAKGFYGSIVKRSGPALQGGSPGTGKRS
jgi:hypothetical protein